MISRSLSRASPAHPLHHVRDEAVRDAGARLLGQVEGVLQLLDGAHAPAGRPPLLLQLGDIEPDARVERERWDDTGPDEW